MTIGEYRGTGTPPKVPLLPREHEVVSQPRVLFASSGQSILTLVRQGLAWMLAFTNLHVPAFG